MNYTQNQKISQVTETTLIVGVDIGSETNFARAFNWRGQELSKKVFRFNNSQEGFQSFLAYWSHKPGTTSCTRYDASGSLITDPQTADRTYSYADYSTFCGYYIITRL